MNKKWFVYGKDLVQVFPQSRRFCVCVFPPPPRFGKKLGSGIRSVVCVMLSPTIGGIVFYGYYISGRKLVYKRYGYVYLCTLYVQASPAVKTDLNSSGIFTPVWVYM